MAIANLKNIDDPAATSSLRILRGCGLQSKTIRTRSNASWWAQQEFFHLAWTTSWTGYEKFVDKRSRRILDTYKHVCSRKAVCVCAIHLTDRFWKRMKEIFTWNAPDFLKHRRTTEGKKWVCSQEYRRLSQCNYSEKWHSNCKLQLSAQCCNNITPSHKAWALSWQHKR